MAQQAWPTRLVLVRHAESVGNLARDVAEANGEALIDIATRDMDVPLSPQGERPGGASWASGWRTTTSARSRVLVAVRPRRGDRSGSRPPRSRHAGSRWCSTSDCASGSSACSTVSRCVGIEARFPDEAAARGRVGKFYYRPPGGESWCDVALRVRSFLDTAGREHAGEEVVVVAHEVVVYLFRYVLERLTEAEVLGLGRATDLANCSVTEYELGQDEQGVGRPRARRLQPRARRSAGDRRTGRAACTTLTTRAPGRSTPPCWPSTRCPTSWTRATRTTAVGVVLVGGDAETPGGVMLAAIAALRAGAGRAHVITDPTATTAMAIAQPELRVSALPEVQDLHGAPDLVASIEHADVVVVGSGCIDHERAGSIVAQVARLVARDAVLLLDAAALAVLGERPELVAELGERAILLPNPTEAARLLSVPDAEADRDLERAARAAVARFRSTVAVRGATTWIAGPTHGPFVDESGHPALGTAGSGDVLVGIVAGLAARGATPLGATLWGVRAHGRGGEALAAEHGGLGLLARDLLDRVAPGIERVGGERPRSVVGEDQHTGLHRLGPG